MRRLGAVVDAAVALRIAPHFNARERGQVGLEALPDPARNVLEARALEPRDVVEIAMVQLLAQGGAARLDVGQVGDEARLRIRGATQHDARRERMSVQSALAIALTVNFGRLRKVMRGVEAEFLDAAPFSMLALSAGPYIG